MKNKKTAIINALIFSDNKFKHGTVIIKGKKIKKVIYKHQKMKFNPDKFNIIDADNSIISYGFIDPHVHLRFPGNEHKEDWHTGSRAAIKGGYTYIIDMPNNNPPATEYEVLKIKNNQAKTTETNYGFHIGLTNTNYKDIKNIYKKCSKTKMPLFGIKSFLGSSTGNLLLTKLSILKNTFKLKKIHLFHAEDENILNHNKPDRYISLENHTDTRPSTAEEQSIKSIIKRVKNKNKSYIYICHVSSQKGVEIIQKYRKKGFKIFAEITPHHLFFNLNEIQDKNAFYKVNPPIRYKNDNEALIKAFNEGFFSTIGTDHAPHKKEEKNSDNPPSGLPGLETSFIALYKMFEENKIKLENILSLLTSGYRVFNIKKRGHIKKGYFADLTIIKKENFTFDADKSETKADFSPYDKLTAGAHIDTVIINGKIVLKNNEFIIGEKK